MSENFVKSMGEKRWVKKKHGWEKKMGENTWVKTL